MADRDDVLAKLAHLRRRAYKPVIEAGDGVPADSKLGGTPYLSAAAAWPACGHCERPMALVLQLNPSQLPEPLRKTYGTDLIQLFYCNGDGDCASAGSGWEPFSTVGAARQVAIDGDPVAPTERPAGELAPRVIRGWTAVDDYPGWQDHARLGVELDDDKLEIADELTASGEKLSGWPRWVQSTEYPSCPDCNKTMRLVFQIDDGLDINMGDGGRGHLTQCPEHRHVLAFAWACS